MNFCFVSMLFFVLANFSILAADVEKKNLNIAVFGGGGTNSYASLLMAEKFAASVEKEFKDIFHQTWSISGGTIPGTLLMHADHAKSASAEYTKTVGRAFPALLDFARDVGGNILNVIFLLQRQEKVVLADPEGLRRRQFEKVLDGYLGDMTFGAGKNNQFVYVASADGQPVFFCDPEIKLPAHDLRCLEGTSCIEGIVGSSTW
jgi:hypothetical protein